MDLSRTFGQLKGIFANNNQGLISAQDVRDLLESVFQFGGLRLPAGQFISNSGQQIGETFVCLNQFIPAPEPASSDVVPNPLNGTIKILRSGVYAINVSLSFEGSNNSKWEGSAFKNDQDMEICTFLELLRPNGDVSTIGGFDPIVINAGDVLEYRIKADGNNKNFILRSGQFYVFRIG